jgi:ribonucleotide reductase beta subunit family protein with ferritin-like domain
MKSCFEISISNKMEPLLAENEDRFVVFPVKYPDLWELFQNHRKALWNESEIDLVDDLRDWKKLTPNEQHFIKNVLAFFAGSDGIVLENIGMRFFNEIQIPEARCFYSIQMYMETVHSIMYAQLLDTYVDDEVEKTHLFRAIHTIPSVQEKALWAQKWINSSDSFATRLLAFGCVEGIFFSGSFCCIYWLKERGILPGLCKSNQFIAADEGLHCDFCVLLYTKYIQNKLPVETVHAIVSEAVAIEKSFILDSLPCALLGMNSGMMSEYIEYVADRFLGQLGYAKIFNARQPFGFMDRICFEDKASFFEGRVTSYQMSVESSATGALNFDEPF